MKYIHTRNWAKCSQHCGKVRAFPTICCIDSGQTPFPARSTDKKIFINEITIANKLEILGIVETRTIFRKL